MSLIDCYECERKISDKALACPHCGAPADKFARRLYKENKAAKFYSEGLKAFEEGQYHLAESLLSLAVDLGHQFAKIKLEDAKRLSDEQKRRWEEEYKAREEIRYRERQKY